MINFTLIRVELEKVLYLHRHDGLFQGNFLEKLSYGNSFLYFYHIKNAHAFPEMVFQKIEGAFQHIISYFFFHNYPWIKLTDIIFIR